MVGVLSLAKEEKPVTWRIWLCSGMGSYIPSSSGGDPGLPRGLALKAAARCTCHEVQGSSSFHHARGVSRSPGHLGYPQSTEHNRNGVAAPCGMPTAAEATKSSFPSHRLRLYFYCISFLTLS